MPRPVGLDAIKRVLRRWQHGVLTAYEAVQGLLEVIDEDNIQEAMPLVSPDLRAAIRELIDRRLRSEVEWDDVKLYYIGSFVPLVPLTPEQRRERYGPRSPSPEEREKMRAETELFRRYFACAEGGPA